MSEDIQGVKILLLEDDQSLRESLVTFWNFDKHKVLATDNVDEAYTLAFSEKPEIIFLDQRIFNEYLGTDLCKKLKKDGCDSIIVGIGQAATRQEWLEAQADYAASGKSSRDLAPYLELVHSAS